MIEYMEKSAALPACMICGGTTQPYCTKTGYGSTWQVVRCVSCGHGFVANRPTVEQLTNIYHGETHLAWDQGATSNYENRPDAANADSH
jgi:hypothetical protein